MDDVNVITLDLAEGDDLSSLKSAIAEAGETTKSDLIVVRISTDASTLTYTSDTDNLTIDIDASEYGALTIIGMGDSGLTIDADQMCQVMYIDGYSTIVNLGGLTIQNGDGGIVNYGGTITISDCEISGNTSRDFGGICNDCGTFTIINSLISGNTATSYSRGGGIYNRSGVLTITGSEISGNTSSYDGGGICNWGGTLVISNGMISGNISSSGGGIYNSDGDVAITNTVVSGNTAYVGGGIYNAYDSTLAIASSTISGNTALNYAGGIYNYYYYEDENETTITNTIVCMNYSGNVEGEISSNSHNNLIGDYYPGFVCPPVFDSDGQLTNADTMDLHLTLNELFECH